MPDPTQAIDDPRRYYRTVAVLFVDFAAARRGISAEDYFECYPRGLFQMSGAELVSDEAMAMVMAETKDRPHTRAAILFAHRFGEKVLQKLFKLGNVEDILWEQD